MCDYKGCKRENYVDKNGKEWNYCIFHLPKGDVPEEVKKELDDGRRRELEKFLALDEKDKKKVIGDFNTALEEYIIDTKSGEDLDLDIAFFFQGFWFHNINLSKRTFKEPVLFTDCIFTGKSNFEGIKFSAGVDFSFTYFLDEVDFNNAKFSGVSFIDAKFLGKANFFASTFSKETYFVGAKFLKNASFVHSKFLEKADFSMIKFLSLDEKLDFSHSEFHNSFIFRNSALSGILSFKNSIFLRNGVVDFTDVKISKDGIIYLTDAFLDNIMVFQDIEKLRLVMGGIRISDKGEIRFIKCDLSEVSFLQVSDMHRITFMGVKWPTIEEGRLEERVKEGLLISNLMLLFLVLVFGAAILSVFIFLFVQNRFVPTVLIGLIVLVGSIRLIHYLDNKLKDLKPSVRDAIMDEKAANKETLPHYWCSVCSSLVLLSDENIKECPLCNSKEIKVLDKLEFYDYLMMAYERLRENYEMNNRHVEAGDFYIGEMEARKKWLEEKNKEHRRMSDIFHQKLIGIYRASSLYGESIFRPVFWIGITGVIFAFLFFLFSNGFSIPIYEKTEIYVPNMFFKQPLDILTSFGYSFAAIYQSPPPELPLIFSLPERLLGLLFNTLFILALNRKFRRKGKIS